MVVKRRSPVGLEVGKAALHEDACVVADDGVDACGGVAGEDHEREEEGDDVFALKEALAGALAGGLLRLLVRGLGHFVELKLGLLGRAGAEQSGKCLVAAATKEEPARRFGDSKAAEDEKNARRERDPEDAAPGIALEGNSVAASEAAATDCTR